MIMLKMPDGFDAGEAEARACKARGESFPAGRLAEIFRTAVQAFNVAHPPVVVQAPKRKRAHVARNPRFDALALATGSDPATMTRTGAIACGVALAEILEVSPDVTPEQIQQAAVKYKRLHRDWPLTAPALSKHWGECGPDDAKDTRSARLDPYMPPPVGWQDTAMRIFPGTLVHVTPWPDLSISIRSDILQKHP